MFGSRVWSLAMTLALLSVAKAPALAQPRFLPDSEWERVNVRRPQAMQLQLEALRQSNAFERLAEFRDESRYRRTGRPVGRLKVRVKEASGRTGVALCTAFLVADDFAATARHCLEPGLGVTALEAKLELNYLDESDTRQVRVFPVEIRPAEADASLDYALVRVQGHPGRQFGMVTLSNRPVQTRDALYVIHNPEGAPQTLSRKDCRAGKPAEGQIQHSCETLGGSSGAPVFSDETLEVVGLHFAAAPEGNYAMSMAALLAKNKLLARLRDEAPRPEAAVLPPLAALPAPGALAAGSSTPVFPWLGIGLGTGLLIDAALQYQEAVDLDERARDLAGSDPDKSQRLEGDRDQAAQRAMIEAALGLVIGSIAYFSFPGSSEGTANGREWRITPGVVPGANTRGTNFRLVVRW